MIRKVKRCKGRNKYDIKDYKQIENINDLEQKHIKFYLIFIFTLINNVVCFYFKATSLIFKVLFVF
jgi:hypothetical protein